MNLFSDQRKEGSEKECDEGTGCTPLKPMKAGQTDSESKPQTETENKPGEYTIRIVLKCLFQS